MSLYSALQTSVSGMAAQANALSAISDNIANSSTTGYKDASTQFETVLGNESTSSYESGSVLTNTRYGVTDQGTITSTTSSTDLAIKGNGFFIVSNSTPSTAGTSAATASYLTRAGSFAADGTGNLVNSAGYTLMGYKIVNGKPSTTLSAVNVSSSNLQAQPSSTGTLTANLPSSTTAAASAATLPSTNSASAVYGQKTSMTLYDNLGNADVYDVYMTKVSDTAATSSSDATSTWEVTAYNSADATSGGFPYTTTVGGTTTNDTPAAITNLTFDSTTGSLVSAAQYDPKTYDPTSSTPGTVTGTSDTLSVAVPNGNSVAIDLSGMTQLATGFSVGANTADGNAPSKLSSVTIGTDGTLSTVYSNGSSGASYDIPLATVNSPDNLTSLSGNVYQTNNNSGTMVISTATTNGTGSILSDSLESSTVDLATELTNMIQAQRGYESNSKVLQAASDLLHTLTQLNL